MTLTEEQIAEIRARAEAATPGPWRTEWSDRDAHYRIIWACAMKLASKGSPSSPSSSNTSASQFPCSLKMIR